jgi:hypothetical protein
MRLSRLVCHGALISTAATFAFASTALAAAPPNDTFSGATPITSLPFSTTEDTTQATIDSADAAAALACGAGGFQLSNSVWFSYTPSSNQLIQIDTSGTDYSVGLAVVAGSPDTGFSSVNCGLGSGVFSLNAGTTYHIDFAEFGAGTGGTLNVSIGSLPNPISAFSIDSTASFDKTSGSATVTGSITCPGGAFAFGSGQLSTDPHGRNAAITGPTFFGSPLSALTCDGTPHPWSVTIAPQSGLFKGGPATATIDIGSCSLFCSSQNFSQQVTLK